MFEIHHKIRNIRSVFSDNIVVYVSYADLAVSIIDLAYAIADKQNTNY